ncbi:hypothetical protein WMF29_11285 [Sorangium sp. So ce381]
MGLAADRVIDGCGVFVSQVFYGGDDANPGTKDRPVRSVQRAIEIARTGRGRVFVTNDGFDDTITLPSGVDIYGGFNPLTWERREAHVVTQIISRESLLIALSVEPARPGDTGAADGVSTIDQVRIASDAHVGMLVQSGTAVEIVHSEVSASYGWKGRDGEEWPFPNRAGDGPDGLYGGDACSATTVAGGAAVTSPCDEGPTSIGGKGGDGLPNGGEDGETGAPVPAPNPDHSGRGGHADRENLGCEQGFTGISGGWGTVGAAGEGIGRITETGWEGDKGGEGGRGMPGQGGGGGGGRRGGLAACGVATKGGAGGGSGGAGGCGGRGGRGAENGYPSIGIIALHAKVTVRDSRIVALDAGAGGDGGPPEEGGKAGRGAPGGALGDGRWSCGGGSGGPGGDGGYGGPGRGGDSIGIAYLDEDELTLEGVTYELGQPGKGGTSWDWAGYEITGEDGNAVKTLRFPE